ncbi:MAG: molybdopterin-synthase adenylyltransferase MoeB [bacterium]
MTSARDLFAQLRQTIAEATPADLLARDTPPVIIDVREADEVAEGQVPEALAIPRGMLELKIEAAVPDRDQPIVCYCAGGTRSLLAAESLGRLGYTHVESMAGGFNRWKDEGRPIAKPEVLSADEKRRYSRHLLIPEVGEAGQLKLKQSKVLLLGAGGLGSPAAFYLAAAGVGTLGLVDFDVVDASNLQRQILHTTDRIGTSKIASARKTLSAFNPDIALVTFEEHLESGNVERLFDGFDIILDGTDNFPTKYLANDACVLMGKPLIHGSVYRFEGQVTVFDPSRGGPCYRCLYPEPPPPELAPSCAEAGVLGVLPGVIGLLQAIEAIKLIVGIGDPLIGRLLMFDALELKFRELRQKRDAECAYCGEGKAFPGFVDYEVFCGSKG